MKRLMTLVLFALPFLCAAQNNLVFNANQELCIVYGKDLSPIEYVEDTLPDGTPTRLYFLYGEGHCRFPDSTIVFWNFNTRFPYPHGSDSSYFNFTNFVIDGHHPVVMTSTGVFEFRHTDFKRLAPKEIVATPEPPESHTIPSINLNDWQMPNPQCTFKGKPIYGNVRIVDNSTVADFKVRLVERDEYASIKIVTNETSRCGEWHLVDSGDDFTVKFVESGEDFSICFRQF